jgi:hypothetical protein
MSNNKASPSRQVIRDLRHAGFAFIPSPLARAAREGMKRREALVRIAAP